MALEQRLNLKQTLQLRMTPQLRQAIKILQVSRAELDKGARAGPLIVEEFDTTVVVPPGWRASLDALANIQLERS